MYTIDRFAAIRSLSYGLDFVGIDQMGHGTRVAVMAAQIARRLGWEETQVLKVAEAGLIHDCGVSSDKVHAHLAAEFHWSRANEHCILGASYLRECSFLSEFSDVILYHHTPWPTFQTNGEVDTETMQLANLVFLADRVDIVQASAMVDSVVLDRIILHKNEIIERISKVADKYFDDTLLEAFIETAKADAFWFSINPDHAQDFLDSLANESRARTLNQKETYSLARMFARIVDAKSPFTHAHSTRVADLSRELAAQMGCDDDTLADIEMSGLLHDSGKLRVADAILEKPGELDLYERAVINQHSFDSGHVLKGIFPNSRILRWVTMHHEKLDGSGYPNRLVESEIDFEAQILAVADVYQALVQDRPYRAGLGSEQALGILNAEAQDGRLNSDVVRLLNEKTDYFYGVATRPTSFGSTDRV